MLEEFIRYEASPARWSIVKFFNKNQARLNSGTNYEFLKVANLPCLLIGGVHEWVNKIPTVPTITIEPVCPRERPWKQPREEKTPKSFTLR